VLMTMTPNEARAVARPTIKIGDSYVFYCEVQEEYKPAAERLRNFTGQLVTVLTVVPTGDPDASTLYHVRAYTGDREFDAHEEELNGWDRDLGQYFWPDATYGPERSSMFLANERS
jgi:hypothetical protein